MSAIPIIPVWIITLGGMIVITFGACLAGVLLFLVARDLMRRGSR